MPTITATTIVRKGFESVVLYAGDEVPEWAADQIGDHLREVDSDGWADRTTADLKAEIEARNAQRTEDIQIVPASGKKADLVAALEADDAAGLASQS